MNICLILATVIAISFSDVYAINEASCISAASMCGTRHAAAGSTTYCSEKRPFFDCVLSNGCDTSHTKYKTEVISKSYSTCPYYSSTASVIVTSLSLPVVLFTVYTFCSR